MREPAIRVPLARLCAAVVCLFVLQVCAVCASPSLLGSEVPKEQAFLQRRRGMLPPDVLPDLTRGQIATARPQLLPHQLMALSPRALKSLLADRDVKCDGCVEKRELAERALAVQHLATRDERVMQSLTLREDTPLSLAEQQSSEVTALEARLGLRCSPDAINSTVVCAASREVGPAVM